MKHDNNFREVEIKEVSLMPAVVALSSTFAILAVFYTLYLMVNGNSFSGPKMIGAIIVIVVFMPFFYALGLSVIFIPIVFVVNYLLKIFPIKIKVTEPKTVLRTRKRVANLNVKAH